MKLRLSILVSKLAVSQKKMIFDKFHKTAVDNCEVSEHKKNTLQFFKSRLESCARQRKVLQNTFPIPVPMEALLQVFCGVQTLLILLGEGRGSVMGPIDFSLLIESDLPGLQLLSLGKGGFSGATTGRGLCSSRAPLAAVGFQRIFFAFYGLQEIHRVLVPNSGLVLLE